MSIFGMGCSCGSSYKDEETRERLINVLERIADALEGPAKAEAARAAVEYRERYVKDALAGMEVLTSNVEGGTPFRCRCGHEPSLHERTAYGTECKYADSEGLCMCSEFRPRA